MYSETPLCSGWTLEADALPESLLREEQPSGFSLPGAQALRAFSDLLGMGDEQEEACEPSLTARFSLPGMLPPDVCGRAILSREINFAALCTQHAELAIDHLCGSGKITLDGEVLASFGSGCPGVRVDLDGALHLARRQTLSICFDDAKGAGVCGAVLLRTSGAARFESVLLTPSADGRTISAAIVFHAQKTGEYAVRAAVVPCEEETPWSESRVIAERAGSVRLRRIFSVRAPKFEAGKPYDAPAIKLELYAYPKKSAAHGTLCDVCTLMTGFPGAVPRSYIPLTREECREDPEALIARAKLIGAPALFLPAPASGLLYRRASQEGVALLPYTPASARLPDYAANVPCSFPVGAPDPLAFSSPEPAAACYQLCASPSAPACDPGLTPGELLRDAAGRDVDPDAPQTEETLGALQALSLRLRAEAARQGQYSGPLCAPGQWKDPAFFSALSGALTPLHLSVLPLRGAWWAQSHFSASLWAFIPETEQAGIYTANARLIDENGGVLASLVQDCPAQGGPAGVISALLPQEPCVLTLRVLLLRSGAVVETQALPVYVGLRGPLEAAFSR